MKSDKNEDIVNYLSKVLTPKEVLFANKRVEEYHPLRETRFRFLFSSYNLCHKRLKKANQKVDVVKSKKDKHLKYLEKLTLSQLGKETIER